MKGSRSKAQKNKKTPQKMKVDENTEQNIEENTEEVNETTITPKKEEEEEKEEVVEEVVEEVIEELISIEPESSPMDTSETEAPPQIENNTNTKRSRAEEDQTSSKKRKMDKNNMFRLTVSFPSGGPTYNYKEVLQEVLKQCNHVNNPVVLTTKFENADTLNKSFDALCKLKVENKSLWLKRRYLPDVGSVNPLKKLAYLPKSAAAQFESLKDYYGAESIEPLGKKGNSKLHVLTFKSDEAANTAAEKKGFEVNGYVVTLRQFFEFDKKAAEAAKEQTESTEKKEEEGEEEEKEKEEGDENAVEEEEDGNEDEVEGNENENEEVEEEEKAENGDAAEEEEESG